MANAILNELGQEIFEARYAYPGETKWAERAKVIARTIASAERDEDKERIEKAFRDVKVIMELVLEQEFEYTLFFSGRGFHMFIFGEIVEEMRSIQYFFREIKSS